MKTIVVTGTPGSGKTEFAKALAKEINAKYLDVNVLIKKNKLAEYYDKKRMCYMVNTNKLNRILIREIKSSKKILVIDSHLAHYLPKKYVDLCIVTKCDLKLLEKRLKKRGYEKEKIRENLDSEIFDVCLIEAMEIGHKVRVVDTTKGFKKDLKTIKSELGL